MVHLLTCGLASAEADRSEGDRRPRSRSAGEEIQQPCTQEGDHRAAGGRSKSCSQWPFPSSPTAESRVHQQLLYQDCVSADVLLSFSVR